MKNRRLIIVLLVLISIAYRIIPAAQVSDMVLCSITASDTAGSVPTANLPEGVKVSSRFWELLRGNEEQELLVIPGGSVFGARVKLENITVADPGNVSSLKSGDVLLSLDGKDIRSISEVKELLAECGDGEVDASFKRGSHTFSAKLPLIRSGDDAKIGITLRDSAAGIGTITYIDPTTRCFGGLGHGICDSESGKLVSISSGTVTGVILGGVHKGSSGKPGELSGILTEKHLGSVYSNTECGVFGKLDTLPTAGDALKLPVGHREDVKEGEAFIYSTVKNGRTAKFTIEISDVDTSSHGTKSFKIKVTDPALLAITGGIVRGMSGSPIIQNGKLVGAVTHVMVANPTEGYGIFIENMLSAAGNQVQPKAA